MTQILQPPKDLNLEVGEHPVTLLRTSTSGKLIWMKLGGLRHWLYWFKRQTNQWKAGYRPLKTNKVVGYPAFFWALHPKETENKSQAYFWDVLEKPLRWSPSSHLANIQLLGRSNVTSTTDAVYLGVTRDNTPSRISLWWLWVLSSSIDSL